MRHTKLYINLAETKGAFAILRHLNICKSFICFDDNVETEVDWKLSVCSVLDLFALGYYTTTTQIYNNPVVLEVLVYYTTIAKLYNKPYSSNSIVNC